MELISHNEAETEALGFRLAEKLKPGDLVALQGGLGVGKTAFTRGIARGLGITARVTSPTFTIVNEYAGTPPLFHFDLYRLTGPDELEPIGFYEYLDRGGVSVIEWSEVLGDELPTDAVIVALETIDHSTAGSYVAGSTRKITIEGIDIC